MRMEEATFVQTDTGGDVAFLITCGPAIASSIHTYIHTYIRDGCGARCGRLSDAVQRAQG